MQVCCCLSVTVTICLNLPTVPHLRSAKENRKRKTTSVKRPAQCARLSAALTSWAAVWKDERTDVKSVIGPTMLQSLGLHFEQYERFSRFCAGPPFQRHYTCSMQSIECVKSRFRGFVLVCYILAQVFLWNLCCPAELSSSSSVTHLSSLSFLFLLV